MNYADIKSVDIQDGTGVRVSIYVSGCHFHCKGCFNPQTWDFRNGYNYTREVENKIFYLCNKDYISGLSIVGGEPLHDLNVQDVFKLCRRFKQTFPDKNIWLWTGFDMQEIKNSDNPYRKGILKFVDYIVDGQFKANLKDRDLKFRGSSNQNIFAKQKDNNFILSDLNK